ncbi:MAG: glycosyltransferase family 2 protein [bacterium]|nr:glycosyltransferase family 2 protein [bacterium]
MKRCILVPVYNEGKVFEKWFPALLKVAQETGSGVIVVDDGSDEKVYFDLKEFPEYDEKVFFLRHEVNCGVGAALETGLQFARKRGAEMVLTIDGDGQHSPEDLKLLMRVLEKGEVDVVNGSRFKKNQVIPLARRLANFFANILNFLLSGFWVTDSQSGMKGFSKRALDDLSLQTPGYEWCTDVFREAAWNKWRVEEVPISVTYNLYTLSKGQSFAVGLDMVARLVVRSLMK